METQTTTVVPPAEDGKFYVVDGEEYDRVTTIIDTVHGGPKSGMAYWGAARMADYIEAVTDGTEFETTAEDIYAELLASPFNPNTVKKAAGQRGDAAHKLFEKLILGEAHTAEVNGSLWVITKTEKFIPTSYDLGAVRAFRDVMQGIEGIQPELRVYSKKHRFAGTSDSIGGTVIADVKTHKPNEKNEPWAPAYWTDFLQEAAYALAYEEMTGIRAEHYMVIIPTEDGNYVTAHGYMEPESFLHTLALYREMQNWKGEV